MRTTWETIRLTNFRGLTPGLPPWVLPLLSCRFYLILLSFWFLTLLVEKKMDLFLLVELSHVLSIKRILRFTFEKFKTHLETSFSSGLRVIVLISLKTES